ncbi:MAG: hypothetical protein GQ582_03285 [Methyloprofundus sp.]|nr:hypothetical protein [Methyloprofundus sp.]
MGSLRTQNKKNKDMRNIAVVNSNTQLSVLRMNQLVLSIIIGLMALVVYLGVLLIPESDIAPKTVTQSVDLSKVPMNPVVSTEIQALKSQLVGLVSGSIESKLNFLSEGLRTGTIATVSLESLQAIQDDVTVLKTYSESGAGRLIATKYLPQTNTQQTVDLAAEVSQLKSLVYFLISSCGLMFAVIGGVWVRQRLALTHMVSEEDDEEEKRKKIQ